MKKKYCVYSHYKEGRLFYIGSGTGSRAYTETDRNPVWLKIAGDIFPDVVISGWFDTQEEARKVEKELILSVKPVAHLHGKKGKFRDIDSNSLIQEWRKAAKV